MFMFRAGAAFPPTFYAQSPLETLSQFVHSFKEECCGVVALLSCLKPSEEDLTKEHETRENQRFLLRK